MDCSYSSKEPACKYPSVFILLTYMLVGFLHSNKKTDALLVILIILTLNLSGTPFTF